MCVRVQREREREREELFASLFCLQGFLGTLGLPGFVGPPGDTGPIGYYGPRGQQGPKGQKVCWRICCWLGRLSHSILLVSCRVNLDSLGYRGPKVGWGARAPWDCPEQQGGQEEMEGRWREKPVTTSEFKLNRVLHLCMQGSKGAAGSRGPKGATVRQSELSSCVK